MPDTPPFRADLNAFYARAYGLTRDELRYILNSTDVKGRGYPSETFRVLKEKETHQHGEYRTRRVLEAWDQHGGAELFHGHGDVTIMTDDTIGDELKNIRE